MPSSLPSSPGIYIFAAKNKAPLYVGKSINLKSRLKQHLEEAKNPSSKQAHFLSQTAYITTLTTESDLAALILEAQLVKTLKPPYNASLKDDKSAIYITFTNKASLQVVLARKNQLNLAEFPNPATQIYGPFQSKQVAQLLIKHIREIFGLCSNPFNRSRRACFYYHLHQCPGACKEEISVSRYKQHLKKAKLFLSGEFKNLQKDLKVQIKAASRAKNFELAARLKKELHSLSHVLSRSSSVNFLKLPAASRAALHDLLVSLNHPRLSSSPQRIECYDIANLQKDHQVGAFSVLIDGQPEPTQYRKFIISPAQSGDPQAMKQMLIRRLRHQDWPQPELIILDGGVGQLSVVSPAIPDQIAVIALSKKKETVHFYDKDQKLVNLNLPLHRPALKILQTARDEAHRFATSFHKQRRKSQLIY